MPKKCSTCSKGIDGIFVARKCRHCGQIFCPDCFESPVCKVCLSKMPKDVHKNIKKKHIVISNLFYMILGAGIIGLVGLEITSNMAFGVAFIVLLGLLITIAVVLRVMDFRVYSKKISKLENTTTPTAVHSE